MFNRQMIIRAGTLGCPFLVNVFSIQPLNIAAFKTYPSSLKLTQICIFIWREAINLENRHFMREKIRNWGLGGLQTELKCWYSKTHLLFVAQPLPFKCLAFAGLNLRMWGPSATWGAWMFTRTSHWGENFWHNNNKHNNMGTMNVYENITLHITQYNEFVYFKCVLKIIKWDWTF